MSALLGHSKNFERLRPSVRAGFGFPIYNDKPALAGYAAGYDEGEGLSMADAADGAPVNDKRAGIHVELSFPNGGSLCEADVALIETLQRCRSILGASKLMGLSYRKTWLMTDALNRTFKSKVVETFPAGAAGARR